MILTIFVSLCYDAEQGISKKCLSAIDFYSEKAVPLGRFF